MWLEPPAKPPQSTEKAISELVNYYRQLVVYHQQSAALAASELARLETLLHSNFPKTPVWQPSASPSSWLGDNSTELIAELEEPTKSLPEIRLLSLEDLTQSIRQILGLNKAKIIRLDYLVLEIGEKYDLPPSQHPKLKQQLKEILVQGANRGLWAKIPDSPDCWTLDLSDFPDLVSHSATSPKNNSNPPKKRASRVAYNRSRLPPCPKLDYYETLTAAISQCLKEHYPRTMDAHDVLRWLYDEPLEGKTRTKAYQAVSDGLNKGCNRNHWHREEIGRYIWKAE